LPITGPINYLIRIGYIIQIGHIGLLLLPDEQTGSLSRARCAVISGPEIFYGWRGVSARRLRVAGVENKLADLSLGKSAQRERSSPDIEDVMLRYRGGMYATLAIALDMRYITHYGAE
jgi:hypothetical protein